MATAAQIKTIHTLKNRVFGNDDAYRSALGGFRVNSSRDLSTGEATTLINGMLACVEKRGYQKRTYGTGKRGQNKHLTQSQAERIDILMQLAGWDIKRMCGFIKHTVGMIKAPQMLTNQEATNIIVGMQVYLFPSEDDYAAVNAMRNSKLKTINIEKK